MTTQVTITLPDEIYRRAQRFAELSGLDIEEVLSERVGISLPPLPNEFNADPVEMLSDEAVKELSEGMMDEALSARMSVLLNRQQNGKLTDSERAELKMLMEVYEVGQLRKAQALVQAVKRGLRGPLEP